MSNENPTLPLWRVMNAARIRATTYYRDDEDVLLEMPPDEATYAAELRAVADWIVERQLEEYSVTLRDVVEVVSWLRLEANRAERGD